MIPLHINLCSSLVDGAQLVAEQGCFAFKKDLHSILQLLFCMIVLAAPLLALVWFELLRMLLLSPRQ